MSFGNWHNEKEGHSFYCAVKCKESFDVGKKAGVAEERERCAGICDVGVKWTPPLAEHPAKLSNEVCFILSKAIRRDQPPQPETKE